MVVVTHALVTLVDHSFVNRMLMGHGHFMVLRHGVLDAPNQKHLEYMQEYRSTQTGSKNKLASDQQSKPTIFHHYHALMGVAGMFIHLFAKNISQNNVKVKTNQCFKCEIPLFSH